MNACIVGGHIEEARNLLGHMRADGHAPCLQCFNVLLNGYAQLSQTQDMEDVLNELIREGLTPNRVTYNTLLNGYVRAGELEQVCTMVDHVPGRQQCFAYSSGTLRVVTCMLCKHAR